MAARNHISLLISIVLLATGCSQDAPDISINIITKVPDSVTSGSAVLRGSGLNDFQVKIDEHGFRLHKIQADTIASSSVYELGGTTFPGNFRTKVSSLDNQQTYMVKSFAVRNDKTFEGDSLLFRTQ